MCQLICKRDGKKMKKKRNILIKQGKTKEAGRLTKRNRLKELPVMVPGTEYRSPDGEEYLLVKQLFKSENKEPIVGHLLLNLKTFEVSYLHQHDLSVYSLVKGAKDG